MKHRDIGWSKFRHSERRGIERNMRSHVSKSSKSKRCVREFYKKMWYTQTTPGRLRRKTGACQHGYTIRGEYPLCDEVRVCTDDTGALVIWIRPNEFGTWEELGVTIFPNGIITSTIADLNKNENRMRYSATELVESMRAAIHKSEFSDDVLNRRFSNVLELFEWWQSVIEVPYFTYWSKYQMVGEDRTRCYNILV